jgi:hypothetical protein
MLALPLLLLAPLPLLRLLWLQLMPLSLRRLLLPRPWKLVSVLASFLG